MSVCAVGLRQEERANRDLFPSSHPAGIPCLSVGALGGFGWCSSEELLPPPPKTLFCWLFSCGVWAEQPLTAFILPPWKESSAWFKVVGTKPSQGSLCPGFVPAELEPLWRRVPGAARAPLVVPTRSGLGFTPGVLLQGLGVSPVWGVPGSRCSTCDPVAGCGHRSAPVPRQQTGLDGTVPVASGSSGCSRQGLFGWILVPFLPQKVGHWNRLSREVLESLEAFPNCAAEAFGAVG